MNEELENREFKLVYFDVFSKMEMTKVSRIQSQRQNPKSELLVVQLISKVEINRSKYKTLINQSI